MGGDAGSITDLYFSTELHFAAIGASALAIALITRMHTEETTTHLEALPRDAGETGRGGRSATSRSRSSPRPSSCVVGAAVAGLVHGADAGDVGGTVGRLAGAALSTLPAVWVGLAVAVLLYGAAAPLHRTGVGRPDRLPPARRVR